MPPFDFWIDPLFNSIQKIVGLVIANWWGGSGYEYGTWHLINALFGEEISAGPLIIKALFRL